MVRTLQAYESVNQYGLIFWTETNWIAISWNRDEFLRKKNIRQNQTEGRWNRKKKIVHQDLRQSQFFLIIGFAVKNWNARMRYHWFGAPPNTEQYWIVCWRATITLIKLVNKLLAPDKLICRHNSLRFQILSIVQVTKGLCTALTYTHTHSLSWRNPLALFVPFEWQAKIIIIFKNWVER